MEERVVNVPLVGGINEEDDVFSVQGTEMLQLVNVQAIKKGAFDTRQGFNLVTKSPTVIEPATAFRDSGGTTQLVSNKIEAIGAYASPTGTRPVLAAGGKFYEYVGSDADHGFREVNDLPEYVGTLAAVSSTGGSIIEIESLLFDNETKRITVWVTGKRTGQELSSDRMMLDQVPGDGNSVYYSVQWADTEAYIVPPTRLNDSGGVPVTRATNLRLVTVRDLTTVATPMAFWFDYVNDRIESVLFNKSTGAPLQTRIVPTTFVTSIVNTHRCFDVVGMQGAVAHTIAWVVCEDDTASNVTAARVEANLGTVDPSTGLITPIAAPIADILPRTGTGPFYFVPWANRGVVLEQEPAMTAAPVPSTDWTGTFSIGIRVIARQYGPEGIATAKLDGQLALGRLVASSTTGVAALAVQGYKYIPYIGFQTNDDVTQVFATTAAPIYYSGAPRTTRPLKTAVNALTTTLPQNGPYDQGGSDPNANSEWAVKLTLDDAYTARQTYMCTGGIAGDDTFILTPSASRPFMGITAGLDGANLQFQRIRESYPQTAHSYPGGLDIAFMATGLPSFNRQINLITIPVPGPANTGFMDGVFPSVDVLDATAGNVIAIATVCVAGGAIRSVAIQDPEAGPGPGYAFIGPGTSLSGIQFDPSVVGAGTLTGAQAWNVTHSLFQEPLGSDQPNRNSGLSVSNFYFSWANQQEHCVHRWSVAHSAGQDLVVLSSTSATPVTNPQADAPFGAASPMRYNNFCEFYRYNSALVVEYAPLVPIFGGSVAKSALSCAMGGPWRLVGGLVADNEKFYAAVSPSGDDSQASTFLLRLAVTDDVAIVVPDGTDFEPRPNPSLFQYVGNKGMFVEAANLMRVTSVPLNVPALRVTDRGLTMGALRNGSSKGTQECFALDYEYTPQNYRSLLRMSDYTFINGGVLSVFDGVNASESGMLLWPQRDLTSVSWSDGSVQQPYVASDPSESTRLFEQFSAVSGSPGLLRTHSTLYNITRPYFVYEAGLNPGTYPARWEQVKTNWGGDPSQNYEAIYADARLQQFSTTTKVGARGGVDFYGPHYYGRYQATPTDFEAASPYNALRRRQAGTSNLSAYFLWAPRAARGWTFPDNAESAYTQAEAGGDFLMSWCYEFADGTGRMVRSAPSSPQQYTVCAEIWSPDDSPRTNGSRRAGGEVSRYKWGFFAPRLELTNRQSSASADPRRVLLQPYSTCEPYSTVLYRMPWSNFQNPISDFVVPRNATRGVVPYASTPYAASNPCGYVTTNINRPPTTPGAADASNALFDGPTGDYMGMLREPYLYTTGGVLDNVATPGCKAMCVHQNRLVVGGADDSTVVWFSKELSPTDAVGFNDLLTLTIEAGGAVTGLASMNSSLFVFKKNDVYVISGTMPDATGNSSSLSEPTRLPSGIGCIDHRSVLSTPIGIFFQSTRSIELLTPDLQITPIGDKVIDLLSLYPYIVSVSHNATTQEVYFVCQSTLLSRTTANANSRVLVYSYLINAWYEWRTDHLGEGQASMAMVGPVPWLAMRNSISSTAQAYVYQQVLGQYVDGLEDTTSPTNAYTYSFIQSLWQTAPFSLNQVQGFQRTKRCRLLARIVNGTGAPGFEFGLGTDNSALQLSQWTSAEANAVAAMQGLLQLETHVANQKGQLLLLACRTLVPTGGVNQFTGAVRFSNIALVVGLKAGLNKRITEEAKH
jgi:hypothetical protein